MIKAIVSFALVLVLSMSSFAGYKEKNERREKCEFPCEQMVKDLNLSDHHISHIKAPYYTVTLSKGAYTLFHLTFHSLLITQLHGNASKP